ncbi:unnamed protein product [Periconia digitata]|uniref:Uncharacterized protein n=1 Tax=Periconia digitata TaxID=1303443 RepID=A0A9W4U7N4_9PLEO|nr:unnamed protein product [Periconia digitata]
MTQSDNGQAKCGFLQIPGEIRNMIYDYVLDDGCVWKIREGRTFKASNGREYPLALLETCKQIHDETRMLAFRGTFSVPNGETLDYKVGMPNRGRHITSIVVENWHHKPLSGKGTNDCRFINQLPNLSQICFVIDDRKHKFVDRKAWFEGDYSANRFILTNIPWNWCINAKVSVRLITRYWSSTTYSLDRRLIGFRT